MHKIKAMLWYHCHLRKSFKWQKYYFIIHFDLLSAYLIILTK